MQVGLTGQSTTSAIGSVTVNDMTVGLTGQDLTLTQGTAKHQTKLQFFLVCQ